MEKKDAVLDDKSALLTLVNMVKKGAVSDEKSILLTYEVLKYLSEIEKEKDIPGTTVTEEEDNSEEIQEKKRKIRRNRRGAKPSRDRIMNPAPPSSSFSPDWVDRQSGTEFGFADSAPIVDEKKRCDPQSIVFWARVKTRNDVFPLLHTKLSLTDIRSGKIVAEGTVTERYFTRRRVMGIIVLRPLYWKESAPFYF